MIGNPEECVRILQDIRENFGIGSTSETPVARQNRMRKEFDALQQGNMSHAKFRANWDRLMEGLVAAGCAPMPKEQLKTKYLSKLRSHAKAFCETTLELFPTAPGSKTYGPARRAETWQEVSYQCCLLETVLQETAKDRQAGDGYHVSLEHLNAMVGELDGGADEARGLAFD